MMTIADLRALADQAEAAMSAEAHKFLDFVEKALGMGSPAPDGVLVEGVGVVQTDPAAASDAPQSADPAPASTDPAAPAADAPTGV